MFTVENKKDMSKSTMAINIPPLMMSSFRPNFCIAMTDISPPTDPERLIMTGKVFQREGKVLLVS